MSVEPRIPARETVYAGHLFRSSLEATWAAFFDRLEWPWVYEPQDLNGYVPDFVIKWPHPLLVEVKPEYHLACLYDHTAKIETSGWRGEALIVGADYAMTGEHAEFSLGLLAERDDGGWLWDAAPWMWCVLGQHFGIRHASCSWACRVCGARDGAHGFRDAERADFLERWGGAKRATRWRPAR